MRPNYLDRQPKATVWAAMAPPPPPPDYDVSRALRRAFTVSGPIDPEWDSLLAQIR